jgi:hypothetical protein
MSVFTGLSSMTGVSTINNTPSIITSDLLIYLDAANPLSYPGSGSVWTSLVSGGRN